ncbi:MAG: DUF302 domain-containing protein [Actinomycetota bacterium]
MEAFTTTTTLSLDDAEAAIRAALIERGFGVLTEIDIAATFKQKLDVDRPPLKILGACNPQLAHRALTIDPAAALALPCNVVLEATAEGTRVSAVDPHAIMDDPAFAELADDAAARLREAVESLA